MWHKFGLRFFPNYTFSQAAAQRRKVPQRFSLPGKEDYVAVRGVAAPLLVNREMITGRYSLCFLGVNMWQVSALDISSQNTKRPGDQGALF